MKLANKLLIPSLLVFQIDPGNAVSDKLARKQCLMRKCGPTIRHGAAFARRSTAKPGRRLTPLHESLGLVSRPVGRRAKNRD